MDKLTDILDAMTNSRRILNYSDQTLKTERSLNKKFINYLADTHGVTAASQLRSIHLKEFQKYISTLKGKKGLPLRPNSINAQITAVHLFIDYMADNDHASRKLKKDLQKIRGDQLLPTSVLEHNQAKKFIQNIDTNNAEGVRNRCIAELMYSGGIRGGELVGLKLDDVDLEKGVIKVLGKGRKERMVPIGKTAVEYLENYIKAVRPFQRNADTIPEVFITYRGTALKLRTLQGIISKLSENVDTGVNVTPHTFRRSCATELIRGDANMYHIKEILGHESIDTLKHYAKLTIVDLKKTHTSCHPRDKWKH